MIVNKILSVIFVNVVVLYLISKYVPEVGFHINFVNCSLEVYLLIGFLFWVINEILKSIVKFVTLPLNWLTLGLFSILINIGFIYLFAFVINHYFANIAQVQLGNIVQVAVLAILIAIGNLLLKKL